MRLLVTNLFLSSFSLSVQPQEKCEAVSCGGGQWGKVHDSIRTLSPRCPVLGHRASGAPAEPPAPWEAHNGKAEVMQSWGVIPDLPAPILSLSHSPNPFITIINPANGPQHFLPKQMNPRYPHLSRFMPNLGALLPISRCLRRANTSLSTFWRCLHPPLNVGTTVNKPDPHPSHKKRMLWSALGGFR